MGKFKVIVAVFVVLMAVLVGVTVAVVSYEFLFDRITRIEQNQEIIGNSITTLSDNDQALSADILELATVAYFQLPTATPMPTDTPHPTATPTPSATPTPIKVLIFEQGGFGDFQTDAIDIPCESAVIEYEIVKHNPESNRERFFLLDLEDPTQSLINAAAPGKDTFSIAADGEFQFNVTAPGVDWQIEIYCLEE